MSNRKLSILAAAVFLTLLPVVAFASTGRLEGMTLSGDYTNDYTNIYQWPSTIVGTGNLVYGEMGNLNVAGGDLAMGAVLPNLWDGKYGVWAIHLRQWTPQAGQGDMTSNPNPGNGGFDPNSNANQSFDLGWGIKSGKNALGLTLSRSYNAFTDEFPGVTWTFKQDNAINENVGFNGDLHRNIFGVGVGGSMETGPKTTLEGAVLWQARSYENSRTGTAAFSYEDNGGSNYVLALRAIHQCTPTMSIIPVFKYYAYDLSNKLSAAGSPTETYNNTAKGWQAGAAGNWTIGTNDLFVLGATFAQNKLDQQQDLFGVAAFANGYSFAPGAYSDTLIATETLTPNVFMALETQVNSWLTLRMGANKGAWRNVKVDGHSGVGTGSVSDVLTLKDSPFGMAMGAGVKLGTLKFDAVLANGFFNNPFSDLVGGNTSGTRTPFTKVSATYAW